jgi:hypothetical protein
MEIGRIYRKHLICFIKDKHFDIVGTESATILDHIQYTSWGTNDNMDTLLENSDIFTDNGSSNTSMTLTSTKP